MSYLIDQAFIQQFQDTFHMTAQQKQSRLENLIRRKAGAVTGEAFTIDLLGATEADQNPARHADLVYADLLQERRFADMQDFRKAELIDEFDKIKLLIQPANQYNQTLISAVNRAKDRVIIQAALGSTRTKTSGLVALPAAQKIANGGTGLTLAKLRQAKILLDDAEMDDSEFFSATGQAMTSQEGIGNLAMPSYVCVCTTKQIDNMLADTTITNVDYNSVKALVSGSINTFMGFMFIRVPSTFLPLSGTTRSAFAYAPRAIEYGVGLETQGLIERLPQKDAWQVLAKGSFGAARAEDRGVVQIDCTET
jgi:hypothetical protein